MFFIEISLYKEKGMKPKMKKIKKIILICLIFLLWLSVAIYSYNEKVRLEKEKIPQVIIINNNYFWKYESGIWNKLSLKKDTDLYNWKKFDIYVDNKYYNKYKYTFTNGKGYFWNNDNKSQSIPSKSVLLNDNSYLSICDYEKVSLNENDNQIISKFSKKNKINYNEIAMKEKYNITEDSSIYIISNYYDNIDYDEVYYIVFYRKNKKNYFITKGNSEQNYKLHIVLDINRKFPNIVLEYYDEDVLDYEMYQYDGKKYNNVTNFEEFTS